MKNIITFLFTLLTLVSFSQERVHELEKLIFGKVNQFRVSEGLLAVKWNDKVYDAAYHHAYYLSDRDITLSHYEVEDRENFVEMERAQDRIKHYYNKNSWGIECLTSINFVKYGGDLEKLAQKVVNSWIKSPSHRKGMLFESPSGTTLKFGAVSVLKVTEFCEWAVPVLVLVN